MAMGFRVGVQLPEVEREVRWREYASMARAAEEVGFDSIWVGDHYLYRGDDRPERGPWEAWTMLAGLAAITERVRLGPLVACLNFHNPAVLAKAAATVDELSGGRLTFGVGAGWNRTEFDAYGIPYDHRASRFEEAFEIVRRLLEGERVTLEGRFHQVHDAVLLPRPGRRCPTWRSGTRGSTGTATRPRDSARSSVRSTRRASAPAVTPLRSSGAHVSSFGWMATPEGARMNRASAHSKDRSTRSAPASARSRTPAPTN